LKKTKPLLPWSHEEIVLGWMAVATILHFHAEDGCDGAAIVCRGGYFTAHEVFLSLFQRETGRRWCCKRRGENVRECPKRQQEQRNRCTCVPVVVSK
jgi:hypothetical protein